MGAVADGCGLLVAAGCLVPRDGGRGPRGDRRSRTQQTTVRAQLSPSDRDSAAAALDRGAAPRWGGADAAGMEAVRGVSQLSRARGAPGPDQSAHPELRSLPWGVRD